MEEFTLQEMMILRCLDGNRINSQTQGKKEKYAKTNMMTLVHLEEFRKEIRWYVGVYFMYQAKKEREEIDMVCKKNLGK